MQTPLPSLIRAPLAGSCLLAALVLSAVARAAAPADSSQPVQVVWKPVEIKYSYVGFTTAYNCDAYEAKMKNILTALGAAPQTKVRATGCIDPNRPSRNFFVTVTTATPIPASEAKEQPNKTERELVERLTGNKDPLTMEPFPAQWKTVDLHRERRLDLQPGDCELMEGLRDEVLPKLSVKVVQDHVACTPRNLSIQTPQLTVSALTPAPKADDATAAEK
jgi:hypothetical protein